MFSIDLYSNFQTILLVQAAVIMAGVIVRHQVLQIYGFWAL